MKAWVRTALAVATVFAGAPGLRGADPTPTDLVMAVQKKYDGIRDFSADFVHTYRGGVLRKELSEAGRLLVKKPGKMRWDYATPEKKLFVSDGVKIYSYIPADKQVMVGTVPTGEAATTPALFLAGKGNLTRDFTPTFGDVPKTFPPSTRALKLVPKTSQPDYDWLVLLLDPSTLALRGLQTSDSQGGVSTMTFGRLKENVGLSDKEFAFEMPRGVDVVTDSGRR